jgi:hypothetical protein
MPNCKAFALNLCPPPPNTQLVREIHYRGAFIDIDSVSAFAKIEVAILYYIEAVLPHRDSVHRRLRLDRLISSPTSDFVSGSAID